MRNEGATRPTWPSAVGSAYPPLECECFAFAFRGFGSHTKTHSRRRTNNGRGGIRTHAGVSPHDFQSCALSHSATRPRPFVPRKGTKPSLSWREWDEPRLRSVVSRNNPQDPFRAHPSLDSNPLCDLLRRSRGFEPHDHTASFLQRREWDEPRFRSVVSPNNPQDSFHAHSVARLEPTL